MTSELTLYNTKTRRKEPFQPITPNSVKMYVCGPTVYNLVHIGNARPVVVFDTLFRLLQTRFEEVTYARNITDIDDKIIKAAADINEPISVISERYTQAYHEDMMALNTLMPTITPYATQNIGPMIRMIAQLIARDHAYEAEGHVLFAVQTMAQYGQLSNRNLEDMLDGARVEVAPYKRYAGDFVLWKPSREGDPGWDSPWGFGRPGWHIECSAMVEEHLGKTIDIHGGGRDLIFPHHENEVAQSVCAHGGDDYVNYWMHNGFVNIDGEKMSKSLGNFRTVRDLLGQHKGEVIRFALLSAHYRSEMDFSVELLQQSKAALDSLYAALRDCEAETGDADLQASAVYKALSDDLNTPLAISELHALAKQLNRGEGDLAATRSLLLQAGELMGMLQQTPEQWFQGQAGDEGLSAEAIEALIVERKEAKAAKDFARSDEIRDQLKQAGVVLEDSKTGTTWRRA
ncbi:cysteine--tRNA ligase [Halioxenophilus aromaticivorans]|uniref:Cysteine--tRNA ligase n=1 Tax=Halioxenophilus aromaticivorans TaxID=1306992 RepID=A0AAV3UAS3_9ALTE